MIDSSDGNVYLQQDIFTVMLSSDLRLQQGNILGHGQYNKCLTQELPNKIVDQASQIKASPLLLKIKAKDR